MEPSILDVEAFSILGKSRRIDCARAHEDCPKHWAAFQPEMERIAPDHRECYGACSEFEEPDEHYTKGSFLYTVGFKATEVKDPEGLDEAKVVGGQFAYFEHTGPITTISETIDAIWKEWMPNNGVWKHRLEPDFELYDYDWNPESGTTQIYIPVDPIV